MAGSLFGKMASDLIGTNDIGRILKPTEYGQAMADDFIMHEDGEEIKFLIKSKTDEFAFTNKGLIFVDGDMASSSKRTITRHDFYYEKVSGISFETAGNIDKDCEIKFTFGSRNFSIDVDKRQVEELKDLYKSLIEISKLQGKNNVLTKKSEEALHLSIDAVSRLMIPNTNQTTIASTHKEITNFNLNWFKSTIDMYNNSDFGHVFDKYINN